MIEEAAGTRMFEEKKDKAKKTMAKKQSRVDEITEMLHTEIEPKLDKLRAEKKNYVDFQKRAAELEKVGRVLRAWEYTDFLKKVVDKEEEAKAVALERKRVEANIKKAQKEGQQAEKDLTEVVKKRDAEMKKGGKLAKLKEETDTLGKEVVKVRTQAEIKQTTMEEEEQKLVEIQTAIEGVRLFFSSYALALLFSDRTPFARTARRNYCARDSQSRHHHRYHQLGQRKTYIP